MKVVKDPMHGDIYLSYTDCRLVDTPEIQRLRRVSQLGVVQWIYPGATHTRFEHSLGTLYLALKIARNVLFENNEIEELEAKRNELSAAAIFHDSGHLPFSHCLEETGFVSECGETGLLLDHKTRSANIAEQVIDSHQDIGLSGKEVSRIVLGTRHDYLSDIISGTLDADRLDYLQRDQLHTGVTYGGIDLRIVSMFRRRGNRLVIDERGVVPAETLLHQRFVLRAVMYDHKITRLVQAMIARAFEYANGRDDINKGKTMEVDDKEISKWDDARFLEELAKYTYSRELVEQIRNRSFLKLAGEALTDSFDKPGGHKKIADEMTPEKRRDWENRIAQELRVKPYEIIIDKGNMDRYVAQEAKIPVYRGEENLGLLETFSPYARNINSQHLRLWGIRLYSPENKMDEARKEFKKVSGGIELQKPTRLRITYSPFR